ncbi:hypothetical protein JL722_9728 [Aureococcus anophagefferens]|nr:hypothetical protein JL722_9728 [Aureococcus anophagefferens]
MVLTHEGLVAEINDNWSFQDKAADEAAAARTHAQYRSVLKALMDRRSQGSCARRAALADRLATALAGDDEASRGALVFDGGVRGAELLPARASAGRRSALHAAGLAASGPRSTAAGYCAAVVAEARCRSTLRVAFWRGPRSGVGAGAGYARSGFGRRTDDPEANPGGRAVELGLGGGPAPCGALQGDGEASGLLRGGVVATRGAAAAARDAVVAGGGATAVAIAALSDLANGDGSPADRGAVAAALRLLGAALRRCGARHAAAALEDRAVPARRGASAPRRRPRRRGDAGAQALRCLWADADVIEAASDEDRVAWLERAALKCSADAARSRAKADVGPDDGDGDDGLGASRRVAECARAIHTFRASALRSVATLATFAASALDAGAWRFGGEAGAERFLDVLGVDLVRLPDGGDDAPRRAAGAPRLACPPLWLALPFVAALSRHCPRACCERVVAAVCVRVKSHEPTLVDVAELEPWYGVGSLVRLARCGYDTVELLALDAVGAVVLRRRSAASPDDFDGAVSRDAAGFENSYDVDGRALAQLTALLGAREPRVSPAAPRLGDRWARAAFCAVAASAFRRLAADATRYERATCDCVARLLAVALDCVWPPPADDGARDAGDDGDAARLAEAATEIAADRRAKSDADDAADRADASLLAIRRCGGPWRTRSCGRRSARRRSRRGSPSSSARPSRPPSSSATRRSRGAHSAAQVACDDALHALRCARALRRRAAASAASPEDARLLGGVADAAVVGLVATAPTPSRSAASPRPARAALSDGADAAKAGDAAGALAALAARLDAAGAADAAELLEFDGGVHGDFDDDGGRSPEPRRGGWLDPGTRRRT